MSSLLLILINHPDPFDLAFFKKNIVFLMKEWNKIYGSIKAICGAFCKYRYRKDVDEWIYKVSVVSAFCRYRYRHSKDVDL
jgi:hypothetical protein